MIINIFCIGKLDQKSSESEIISRYLKRITAKVNIAELEVKNKNLDINAKKDAESDLLLSQYKKGKKIVLDEKGKNLSSNQLANQIANWNLQGISDLNFFIGGADGHNKKIIENADLILSLSPLTFPHMLARTILIEQIYRIQTIASGHPYHK